MRVRIGKTAVAIAVALTAALAPAAIPATAHADPGSSGTSTGSLGRDNSALLSKNSAFLWANPPSRYIVILGAKMGTFGQTPDILKRRLDVGGSLAHSHPVNRVVVSGGGTWWLPISEAQFMNVGLMRRGIPPWQMVNEDRSTSTVENATNTVAMLQHMGATGALIVTNGFHISRAMKDFHTAADKAHAHLKFQAAYA